MDLALADDSETLRAFLNRRQQELTQQIAAIQAEVAREVAKRQAELDEIERALAALGIVSAVGRAEGHSTAVGVSAEVTMEIDTGPPTDGAANLADAMCAAVTLAKRTQRALKEADERWPYLPFESLTLKELVLKALTDHFEDGATAAQLVELLRNAYGRNVERSSLSPQLSRLKDDGWLEQLPGAAWNLTQEKRRAQVNMKSLQQLRGPRNQ